MPDVVTLHIIGRWVFWIPLLWWFLFYHAADSLGISLITCRLLSFVRASLEQPLFCGYLNFTSDDSVTFVLSFLTGGNMNMCEPRGLFGLCFPVFLSQDSWRDILLICTSLLSHGSRDAPLHTSWAFSVHAALSFQSLVLQMLAFSASLSAHLCPRYVVI